MNEMINTYLLAGDNFMPKMHLRQPRFTYKGFQLFTKNKERNLKQKFKETWYLTNIYQNKLDKTCFQHDVAYGDFKHLPGRTASDKVSRDKAFNNAKNPKYDGYQRGLVSVD